MAGAIISLLLLIPSFRVLIIHRQSVSLFYFGFLMFITFSFLLLCLHNYYIFCIPIIIGFANVVNFDINVPFWDEWDSIIRFVDKVLNGGLKLSDFFAQHNENRMFFPRIIFLIIGLLTDMNMKVFMHISWVFMTFTYTLIIIYLKNIESHYKDNKNVVGLLVGFLVFSTVQVENILSGFQMAWFMICSFAVASFYFFYLSCHRNSRKFLFISIVCGIITSFSSANGLFVFPSIICVQLLLVLTKKKVNAMFFISTISVTAITFLTYFINYREPVSHPDYFGASLVNLSRYFIVCIGSSITPGYLNRVFKEILVFYFGVIILVLIICLFFYLIYNKKIYDNMFPISLIIFSLFFVLAVTMGRAGFGVEQAAASRYTTYTLLLVIGIILIIFKEASLTNSKVSVLTKSGFCVLFFMAFFNFFDFNSLMSWYGYRYNAESILVDYKNRSLAELRVLYPWRDVETAKRVISILEDRKWSVFNNIVPYTSYTFETFAPIQISEIPFYKMDIFSSVINGEELYLICGNSDPYVVMPLPEPVELPAGRPYIEIEYNNDTAGDLQVFYDYGKGFSEEHSTGRFSIDSSEGSKDRLILSVVGWLAGSQLQAIRIDPPNGSVFVLSEINILNAK
jgi:hypothetical protein